MNKKIIIGIIIVVLIVVGYVLFGKDKLKISVVDKKDNTETIKETDIAATVNGIEILKSTFNTQLATALASLKTQGVDVENADTLSKIKTQVINDLINNELVNDGIAKSGIKPSSEEIEKQFQVILTQTGGEEKLKAELVKSNLTETQFRENIAKQLTLQAYLLQNVDIKSITVSDDEIKQFYADYSKAQKDSGQKVLPIKDLTEQIKQQITLNKQQMLVNNFVNSLREKAKVEVSI